MLVLRPFAITLSFPIPILVSAACPTLALSPRPLVPSPARPITRCPITSSVVSSPTPVVSSHLVRTSSCLLVLSFLHSSISRPSSTHLALPLLLSSHSLVGRRLFPLVFYLVRSSPR